MEGIFHGTFCFICEGKRITNRSYSRFCYKCSPYTAGKEMRIKKVKAQRIIVGMDDKSPVKT
jgi:hypothetical protein